MTETDGKSTGAEATSAVRVEQALAPVGAIYDAAVDAERWQPALEAMAAALDAPAGVLRLGYAGRSSSVVAASTGLEPAAVIAFEATDPDRDPMCLVAQRARGEPVASGADLGADEVATSEIARLVLAPSGLGAVLGVNVGEGEEPYLSLWFFRPEARPFGVAAKRALATWVPHLRRSLVIHRRLAEATTHAVAGAQAIDRLALGAVVVDEDARPLIVNRIASRILDAGDGLAASPTGLCGMTSDATAELRTALREVVQEAAASGHTRSAGLRLERGSNPRPFDVIIVSLRRPQASRPRQPAAIVFIADPDRTHVAPERLLRELYGLTPAESRLAMVLARGRTLTDTAAALEISRNTAHAQLASIYAKTGTATQAELVRLLHRGPAAIRPYEDSSELRPVPAP